MRREHSYWLALRPIRSGDCLGGWGLLAAIFAPFIKDLHHQYDKDSQHLGLPWRQVHLNPKSRVCSIAYSAEFEPYLNIFCFPLCVCHSSKQSVTNIFEYSNIRIYWSRIYIRTFVRVNFSFTNIFGHSFVSNMFVRIYSDIRW